MNHMSKQVAYPSFIYDNVKLNKFYENVNY